MFSLKLSGTKSTTQKSRFSFQGLALPEETTALVPFQARGHVQSSAVTGSLADGNFIDGSFSTIAEINPAYRFQGIGSCPVAFRASLMRIVVFKLLGSGVFVALSAIGSNDPKIVKSCALSAAVNTVAIVHYIFSTLSPRIASNCAVHFVPMLAPACTLQFGGFDCRP